MQTLIEVRSEIKAKGIIPIYQLYQVTTPNGVMISVIFNMLHSLSMKQANDNDAKEFLMYQRAIFELAREEDSKNHSFYSEPKNQ